MITVEKVLNKNAEKEAEKFKNADQPIPGAVQEVKKSYLPWIVLAGAAVVAAWYFFFRHKKGSGNNEGVPG
jgi:type VI protein secretion system component VasF